MKINVQPEFQTDSLEYEQLKNAIAETKDVEGATCEIGLRAGGGTMHMLDSLIETEQYHTKSHITVDPYGNIDYVHNDDTVWKVDYTNRMRDDCLMNIYVYQVLTECKVDFHFFNLEDTEFFKRYADGVPVYNEVKKFITKYSVVHLDGPHSVAALLPEIEFFHPRMDKGAKIIFDDTELYSHEKIHEYMLSIGWERTVLGERKQTYTKL